MICFIALIVFAVLGIFSAKYRNYAKEAFDCVFRRMTLRKCTTAFDKKMKMKVTGKLMKTSPKTGGIVFRNFELISWIFTAIMIISFAYSVLGIYNFVVYNNCEGPNAVGPCIYNEIGELTNGINAPLCESQHCAVHGCDCTDETCNENNGFEACDGNCNCIEAVCME
ncbi:MAG: hypothetical protein COT90_03765 [Candidatus Diapherotrites archaeon CG10_big_fil_rev_8_21_14_0_10_31_34]|nr:MAG: hypothetical protein COT90_03765 [Candidatus Diapherotrites archaeon CG10_big_fil_rev_8_21_14_0_10_31_34]PJA20434.1 MAG: hypothetical protein COX63_00845 [Candidatus Diapherotrites archaeon CG_4_10_14_0_2_um_filter_31_5]